MRLTRRGFVGAAALAGFAALSRRLPASPPARVLVVGGGYAGACCAKYLQRLDPALAVTLLTRPDPYYTCPFSNLLLAGRLGLDELEQRHDALAHAGIEVRYGEAIAVDPVAKRVQLDDGSALVADRLVLAPGVEFAFDALPGYDAAAAAILPHAWEAGAQTVLLRRQLEALPDGGTVLISVPPEPYRCPPGPYERASLIAWWLRRARPRAKLLILDAKDRFSKQALFREGWQALYGQQLEWVPGSDGGRIERVEAATRTLHAGFGFGPYRGDVVNVIPPQRAPKLLREAGLTDASGWCPVSPLAFESSRHPGVHVLGDAADAAPMPKSAYSATSQARAVAAAIVAQLRGEVPAAPVYLNTCYSLLAPDYGISIAAVYRVADGRLTAVPEAGGTSPLAADAAFRAREAVFAAGTWTSLNADAFG